jgi:hypothetical protein
LNSSRFHISLPNSRKSTDLHRSFDGDDEECREENQNLNDVSPKIMIALKNKFIERISLIYHTTALIPPKHV